MLLFVVVCRLGWVCIDIVGVVAQVAAVFLFYVGLDVLIAGVFGDSLEVVSI